MEQAEFARDALQYILTLYRQFPAEDGAPHPESVIVIGHSMGGIVARQMLLMPDLEPDAVNTLITLSTPHLLPPAPFDARIEKIYEDINGAWSNNLSCHDLALVSISGGEGDTMIPSDTVSLASVVPKTNSMTIFTTAVPHLWAPVDHQAMVWCDQLRTRIVLALFDMQNIRDVSKTKPLAKRMEIFRQHLLNTYRDVVLAPTEPDRDSFTRLDVPVTSSFDTFRLIARTPRMQPEACAAEEGGCQVFNFDSIQALPAFHRGQVASTSDDPLWELSLKGHHLHDADYLKLVGTTEKDLLLHDFATEGPTQQLQWTLTGTFVFFVVHMAKGLSPD